MLVHAPTNICNGGELKQQIQEGFKGPEDARLGLIGTAVV